MPEHKFLTLWYSQINIKKKKKGKGKKVVSFISVLLFVIVRNLCWPPLTYIIVLLTPFECKRDLKMMDCHVHD